MLIAFFTPSPPAAPTPRATPPANKDAVPATFTNVDLLKPGSSAKGAKPDPPPIGSPSWY